MNSDRTYVLGATADSPVLPAAAFVAALSVGMATAVVGSVASDRPLYYTAVLALFAVGLIVAATRKEPLRFVFLSLIACFPVALATVPPGRLQITVFDAVMFALTVALIGKRMFASPPAREPLFPTNSLLFAWLLSVPSVLFSQFLPVSLLIFALNLGLYGFFLFTLGELRREGGFERLVLLLSVVLLVMAAGFFADAFLHVNLSLRGSNLNQRTYAAGVEVWRAGGFFQDPQKGGAFLASMIAFLLLLAVRGRFRGTALRFLVWAAILASLAALVTTVSRAAILACLSVSAVTLFAFNRWNAPAKLAIVAGAILAATLAALTPAEAWRDTVPAAVAERFVTFRTDFTNRISIWFDTWDMFADHPLTGIGLGSFQSYLIETRPSVVNFYDIGSAAGVSYVPDQPESGYFKILYEGGAAGTLAALLVAGDALRRAVAVAAGAHTDPDARTEAVAALAALIAFAITFVTLFTVSDKRLAGMLAFFLAVIWHRSLQSRRAAPKA